MFKGNIKTVIGILFLGLISMGAMAISSRLIRKIIFILV